eukprot:1147935-Pelagomonas_calceolata.AAC.7
MSSSPLEASCNHRSLHIVLNFRPKSVYPLIFTLKGCCDVHPPRAHQAQPDTLYDATPEAARCSWIGVSAAGCEHPHAGVHGCGRSAGPSVSLKKFSPQYISHAGALQSLALPDETSLKNH